MLPILKAYGWPAVLAPVGTWMDTPADRKVDFGGNMQPRDRFLDWNDVREISRSGLVEIAAHTDASHYGALANPQGNTEPAAAVRKYDARNGRYERGRLRATHGPRRGRDQRKIRRATGKAPRVWVWPYGAEGGTTLRIAGEQGYQMALTLEDGPSRVARLMSTPRMLLANDPTIRHFANSVASIETVPAMRFAHVDLDYIYDPDPAQTDRNLGELVQRIVDMQINTVFLQAYADPQADGLVRSVYFPNRWLPMRADLFNRVAWQLHNRADVFVYAWMPVLALDLDPSIARVVRWDPQRPEAAPAPDPDLYRRLSPFDPVARQRIGDLYEDLARHAFFDGILFHDDAMLGDFEDAGPAALAAYQKAGLPGSIAALRADPGTMQRWTRYKSRHLVDFTAELAERARAVRGPRIKTARNLYAEPLLNPPAKPGSRKTRTTSWTPTTGPRPWPCLTWKKCRRARNWLAPHRRRGGQAPAGRAGPDRVRAAGRRLAHRPRPAEPTPVDTATLAGWMQRLQLRGARSFGYYPDDFSQDQPRLQGIRPAISEAWFPIR